MSVIYNIDSMVYPVVNLTEYTMTLKLHKSSGDTIKDQEKIFNFTAKFISQQVEYDEKNEPHVKTNIMDLKLEKCKIDKHFGKYKDFF
jgi:hypothetical protein